MFWIISIEKYLRFSLHLNVSLINTCAHAACIHTYLCARVWEAQKQMENGNIDFVFEELKRIGQCTSRSQFSREWLGREESYYRSIQSKGRRPSAEAQLNLVSRLRDLGMSFSRSSCQYPTLVELGNTYLKLYGECLDALLN